MTHFRTLLSKLTPIQRERTTTIVDARNSDGRDTERGLLRLLTLGVVKDYTVDYSSHEFTVTLSGASRDQLIASFAKFVAGYNRGSVLAEVSKLNRLTKETFDQFVSSSGQVLIEFIYGTIEKGRRRALREMLSLAEEAAANPMRQNELIRERILRYLQTTYSEELEKILEAEDEGLEDVVRLLGGYVGESGEVIGGIRSVKDAAEVRGQVIRYLESQPDHPGLLILRAASEALCDTPDEAIIIENFQSAHRYAQSRQNLMKQKMADGFAGVLIEINSVRPAVYHSVASGIFNSLQDKEMAKSVLQRSVADPGLALESGLFLVTTYSRDANLLFQSN